MTKLEILRARMEILVKEFQDIRDQYVFTYESIASLASEITEMETIEKLRNDGCTGDILVKKFDESIDCGGAN